MTTERTIYKLSDQFIAQIRELVQLAILTNTNIVDHMRQMRVEVTPEQELVPTAEYIEYYNGVVTSLIKKVESMQAEMQATPATDETKKGN